MNRLGNVKGGVSLVLIVSLGIFQNTNIIPIPQEFNITRGDLIVSFYSDTRVTITQSIAFPMIAHS